MATGKATSLYLCKVPRDWQHSGHGSTQTHSLTPPPTQAVLPGFMI